MYEQRYQLPPARGAGSDGGTNACVRKMNRNHVNTNINNPVR